MFTIGRNLRNPIFQSVTAIRTCKACINGLDEQIDRPIACTNDAAPTPRFLYKELRL